MACRFAGCEGPGKEREELIQSLKIGAEDVLVLPVQSEEGEKLASIEAWH
jgi:hypothetical protein